MRTLVLVAGLLVAAAPAAARRIQVICSPEYGAAGSIGFAGEGGRMHHADGFPACEEGERWNWLADSAEWTGASFQADGAVEEANAAVTVSASLGMALEKGVYGEAVMVMQVEGLFVAPLAAGPVPAEIVISIARGGASEGFALYGSVQGPGVDLARLGAPSPTGSTASKWSSSRAGSTRCSST